ncbi:MAG: hypothetical protein Q8N77_05130 [Nanoarchaeota archaeon]|nr:hypothetical protein [Nanoarchaeota archaeon]
MADKCGIGYVKKGSIKPKTVDELYEHNGDLVQVDSYGSITDLVLRRKITGRMEIVEASKNKEYYGQQKELIWGINCTKGFYRFVTIKENYTIDDLAEEWSRGHSEKKLKEKEIKKEFMPLEKITILECYHEGK